MMIWLLAIATLGATPAEDLVEARHRFDALDYAGSVALAKAVLNATEKPADRLTADDKRVRLAALFMLGYAHAAEERVDLASADFARAMELDVTAVPDFLLEPQIQLILDVARTTRQKELAAVTAATRQAILDGIQLDVTPPEGEITGGMRLIFAVHLTDPTSAVKSMRIDFKKNGERELYGLPVILHKDGTWRGEIPGTFTRSARTDARMLWFITASDVDGNALKSVGARDAPRELFIKQGSGVALDLKANERLPPATRFLFAALAAPLATASGMGLFIVALSLLDQTFGNFLTASRLYPWVVAGGTIAGAVGGDLIVGAELVDPGLGLIVPAVVVGLVAIAAAVGAARYGSGSLNSVPADGLFLSGASAATILALIGTTGAVLADPPDE